MNKNDTRERLHLLYEKGKIKNEVNRLLSEKNEQTKLQEELSKCTFYPQVNKKRNNNDKNKNNLEGNFYERLTNWQNKIDKK